MNFIEFLVRIVFGRRGLIKALVVYLVLWAISMFAGLLVKQNLGEDAGLVVVFLVPTAAVVLVLVNPVASRTRLWLFEGIYAAISVGIVVAIGGLIVTLFQAGLHLDQWFPPAWPYAAGLGAALLLRLLCAWRVKRGHRALGGCSVLNED